MSTSQGRRLHSRDSFSITQPGLSLVMRCDMPRPQVFEQGLHGVVWVMQFLCQKSLVVRDTEKDIKKRCNSSVIRNLNNARSPDDAIDIYHHMAHRPQERVWGWSCVVYGTLRRSISHNTGLGSSLVWATDTRPGAVGTRCKVTHIQSPHSHTDSGTYNWVGSFGHYGKSHLYTHSLFP